MPARALRSQDSGRSLLGHQLRRQAAGAARGRRLQFLFLHPSGSDLALLADLIEQGHLRVIIDKTYPFAKIAEALAYVETGRAKGKVVVIQRISSSRP